MHDSVSLVRANKMDRVRKPVQQQVTVSRWGDWVIFAGKNQRRNVAKNREFEVIINFSGRPGRANRPHRGQKIIAQIGFFTLIAADLRWIEKREVFCTHDSIVHSVAHSIQQCFFECQRTDSD